MATEAAPRAAYIPAWTFADKIRKARSVSGLEQREFAQRVELTASTVAAYETGRSTPRFRDVAPLSKRIQLLTGIDYRWFLDIEASMVTGQVGPGRLELPTSTVEYGKLATVTPIRAVAA
jgi:transcriptional regulator with XRE-family HTH domain